MIGYLDIETSFGGEVTVVGVLRMDRGLVQLVGQAVTKTAVEDVLSGIDTVCTYNGEGFDLPVLRRSLGLDLLASRRSLDLAHSYRRLGIRGGLKAVEARVSVPRRLGGVNGYHAMLLWERWRSGDRRALETLLAYNREDVVNLVALERRLAGDLAPLPPVECVVVGA